VTCDGRLFYRPAAATGNALFPTVDNTPFWIHAGTVRMTLNDLECPLQLKVCCTEGTLDVRMLWLSELAMRD